jgi:Pyrroloquinoline quinone (Coenzyme PQQ) biosynthesis protein C
MFFEVHKGADVVHREECEKLLNDLTAAEQKKAEHAALTTAKYMWNFLSGVSIKHGIPLKVAA